MPEERVRAQPSPLRCPFCHEQVDVEANDWVACAGCLGRHHGACWDEAGHCSACEGGKTLSPREAARAARADDARPREAPAAASLHRLIEAHERGSKSAFLDYLGLLDRGVDEERAKRLLGEHQLAYSQLGTRALVGTAVFHLVPFPAFPIGLPFWLAYAFRSPLALHEERETALEELHPRPGSGKNEDPA